MNLTAEELQKKLSELPPAITEAIRSVDFGSKLQDVGEKHKLHVDVMDALFAEVGYLMLGLTKPEEFRKKIQDVTKTSEEEAQNIVLDINAKILDPIKKDLIELHGVNSEKYFTTEASRLDRNELRANTESKAAQTIHSETAPVNASEPEKKPPINVLTYGAVVPSQKTPETPVSKGSGGAASALASKPYEWDEKKVNQNINQAQSKSPVPESKTVIDLNTLKTSQVKEPLKNILPVEDKVPKEISKPQSELEKILNPSSSKPSDEKIAHVINPAQPTSQTINHTPSSSHINPNRRLSLAEEAALLKEKNKILDTKPAEVTESAHHDAPKPVSTKAIETKPVVDTPSTPSKLQNIEIKSLNASLPDVKVIPEEKIAEKITNNKTTEKQVEPHNKLTEVVQKKRVVLTLKKPLSEIVAEAEKKKQESLLKEAPKKQVDPYREPID